MRRRPSCRPTRPGASSAELSRTTISPTPSIRTGRQCRTRSFIILQAPPFISVGAGPHSWGQSLVGHQAVSGLALGIVRPAKGTLHYLVTLRAFSKAGQPIERKAIGNASIDASEPQQVLFNDVLEVTSGETHTVEIDVSWQGAEPLALNAPPTAING